MEHRLASHAQKVDWRFAASKRIAHDAPSLAAWYVVSVIGVRELAVMEKMQEAGIHAIAPTTKELKAATRKRPAHTVEQVYLPGYVFVRCVPSARAWSGVMTFDGVRAILGNERGPVCVSDKQVEKFVMAVEKVAVDFSRGGLRFKAGDAVRISQGAFEHKAGSVAQGYAGQALVPVEVEAMGRSVIVLVAVDSVKRHD